MVRSLVGQIVSKFLVERKRLAILPEQWRRIVFELDPDEPWFSKRSKNSGKRHGRNFGRPLLVGLNPRAEKSEQAMPAIRRCRDDENPALLRIINLAAKKYQGVIPADRWHEPYMDADVLTAEIKAGVEFWGAELDAALVGVMGVQEVLDVDLIRHAYVLPACQGKGIGGDLLMQLCSRRSRPVLVGTWAAASWAIDFYRRHGFGVVQPEEAKALLKKYWTIPDRQIETSVVLRRK